MVEQVDRDAVDAFHRASMSALLATDMNSEGLINHAHSLLAEAFARHRELGRRQGLEEAAKVADDWRDENKASAVDAEKQGNRGFAAELRTAAVECNALATSIRKLGEAE